MSVAYADNCLQWTIKLYLTSNPNQIFFYKNFTVGTRVTRHKLYAYLCLWYAHELSLKTKTTIIVRKDGEFYVGEIKVQEGMQHITNEYFRRNNTIEFTTTNATIYF